MPGLRPADHSFAVEPVAVVPLRPVLALPRPPLPAGEPRFRDRELFAEPITQLRYPRVELRNGLRDEEGEAENLEARFAPGGTYIWA